MKARCCGADTKTRRPRRGVTLLVALSPCLLVCLLAGCGTRPVPVKGVVTYEGRPLPHAFVVFIAQEPGGRDASGVTDAQGAFQLSTFQTTGALPGLYKVTVQYSTSDGTGTAGVDYTAKTGVLTFNAGINTATFTVPARGNTRVDGPRTVNLALGTVTSGNAAVGPQDDDLFFAVLRVVAERACHPRRIARERGTVRGEHRVRSAEPLRGIVESRSPAPESNGALVILNQAAVRAAGIRRRRQCRKQHVGIDGAERRIGLELRKAHPGVLAPKNSC